MQIKPLAGYVLIKPDEKKEKTDSGILLPQEDKKSETGVVERIGAHTEDLTFEGKQGDRVLFKQWSGIEYQKYLLVKFEDIVAII